MADTCRACGHPRQSYIAGYEKAEAKSETRVAELEAALRLIGDRVEEGALDPAEARAIAEDALKGDDLGSR